MKRHIVAILFIICASFLVHFKLFFPELHLIATPEFELNDAIQLSYASKYWYAETIRHFQLPFWSSQAGVGFPMLGEGQTGIFFLPNIILYSLFSSAPLAYNLSLVFVSITTALGTYWWLSLLRIPRIISILGGLTFSFSGFFLFHQQHITLLQSFSLFPWLLATTHQLIYKPRKHIIVLFAFLLSQQLFAGFVQAVVITIITTTAYIGMLLSSIRKKRSLILNYILACALGILLAGAQLLPSIEFFTYINNYQDSTEFSMPLKSFLSFFYPFIIGNPQNGTYYRNNWDTGLLFWETNGYVGIIPIIILVLALCIHTIRKKLFPYIIYVCAFALLALGKYSPLYVIYDIPPFSLFRVPARFIIVCSFFLVTIMASTLSYIQTVFKKNKYIHIITVCLLSLNLLLIVPFWFSYHEYTKPSEIHSQPEVLKTISKDSIVYRLNATQNHRKLYLTQGWKNIDPFTIFQNTLRPNSNLFWDTTTFDAYPSRTLKRHKYAERLILNGIDSSTQETTISATTERLMKLMSINTIISGSPINSNSSYKLETTITDDTTNIYVYATTTSNPRSYMASTIIPVTTITDVLTLSKLDTFDPKNTALVEASTVSQTISNTNTGTSTITTWSDRKIEIEVDNPNNTGLLVVTNTYYSGWKAMVDGTSSTIYPTNVRFMGVFIPQGHHTITFTYTPSSFIIGGILTIVGMSFSILLLFSKRINIFWKSHFK